jgi:hypothetical protein
MTILSGYMVILITIIFVWFSIGILSFETQVSSIKVRNSKPVRLVLEAVNEQEEKKRRAIAFREATEEEKRALQVVSQIEFKLKLRILLCPFISFVDSQL